MNPNLNANEPGFLGKKLDGAEWPVDPAVWHAVSAQVSASAAAASTGTATSTGLLTKVALWVAAASLVTAGIVAVVRESKPVATPVAQTQASEQPESNPEPSRTEAPSPAEQAPAAAEAEAVTNTAIQPSQTPEAAVQPAPNTVTRTQQVTASAAAQDFSQSTEPVQTAQAAHPSNPKNPAQAATAQTSNPAASPTPLTVDFDVIVSENDELEIQFDAILGEAAECEWNFGDGQRASGESVTHRYAGEGRYTVAIAARDEDGREARFEAEVDVRRSPKLVLPNIFTPNYDGLNDFLTIAAESRNIAVERMVVIDGNGRLVYEATGDSAAWDGMLPSGEAAPEGSYRLVVSAVTTTGERIHESAIVRLAR